MRLLVTTHCYVSECHEVSIYGWEVPTASCADLHLAFLYITHHTLQAMGGLGTWLIFQSTCVQFFSSMFYHKISFVTHKHVLQSTQRTYTYTTPIKMLQKINYKNVQKKKKHLHTMITTQ